MFSLVELLSAPLPLQPPAGPCHTVRQPQARGERPPQADRRGGLALPCLGAWEREKERGPTRSSVDQRMRRWRAGRWRLEAQQGRKEMLLLRRGRRRCRGGSRGDLLSTLPVLLCSRAWAGSGTRSRGGGLGRAWGRGRGRTRTLGVVHVLSSRPGVRLPMGVVVLFRRREGKNWPVFTLKCSGLLSFSFISMKIKWFWVNRCLGLNKCISIKIMQYCQPNFSYLKNCKNPCSELSWRN